MKIAGKVLKGQKRKKAVSSVVGGVIIFAIIFSSVATFFVAVQQQSNQRAQLDKSANAEGLAVNVNTLVGSDYLIANITNTGPSTIKIIGVFVSQGGIAAATQLSTPNPSSPIAINPGGSIDINTYLTYVSSGVAWVKAITSLGSEGTGFYPSPNSGPAIITQLSSGSIAAGQSVFDSASLAGVSQTAGGTVNYYYYGPDTSPGTCPPKPGTPQYATVSSAGSSQVSNGQVLQSSTTIQFDNVNPSGTYYYWYAQYSVGSNTPITSTCEQLLVGASTSSISTTLSSNIVAVGTPVSDSATLTGVVPSTIGAGTITFYVFSAGNPCQSSGIQVGLPVTIDNSNPDSSYSSSSSETFTSAGIFYWDAVYNPASGDTNNVPATSSCEQLKVTPVLVTSLSSSVVTVGSLVSDTATLSGSTTPSGSPTITFYIGAENQCPNVGASQLGSSVSVTGDGSYSSISKQFTPSNAYYWYATYSGDANNPGPVTSQCEVLLVENSFGVTNANPAISTTLSSPSISAGTAVTDQASLIGGTGPTGMIIFEAFTSSTCTGSASYVSNPIAVGGNGQYLSYPPFVPSSIGTYYWEAFYSGDNFNNPTSSSCGSEVLTVSPANPTIRTVLSSSNIIAGQSVTDSATLTGTSGNAGGTVTYYTYSDSACTKRQNPVNTVTVTNSIVPVSNPVQFKTVGSFGWNAVYSPGGDPNNNGNTSPCEPLTVVAATATTPTPCSGTTCMVGVQTFGAFAFDYNTFRVYTLNNPGSCFPYLTSATGTLGEYPVGCTLDNVGTGYTIQGSNTGSKYCDSYCIFSVDLINVDNLGRAVTLDQNSFLEEVTVCAQTSAQGCGQETYTPIWQIGCVQIVKGQYTVTAWGSGGKVGEGQSCGSSSGITVNYGQRATIYFVDQYSQDPPVGIGSNWGAKTLTLTPVFLPLHGTASSPATGSSPIAENIPFATTLWQSGYQFPPYIYITPLTGPPSGSYTMSVSGGSFSPYTAINVCFDGVSETITGGSSVTDAAGSFSNVNFTVPSASVGPHSVQVVPVGQSCTSGNGATTSFTVSLPSIVVYPSDGSTGATVTVVGSSFLPWSSTITIAWNGATQVTSPSPCLTDRTGGFVCSFAVPSASTGTYTISATDSAENTATTDFSHA